MRGRGAALLSAAAAAALAGRAASSYPPTGSEWARVPSNPVLRPELPWEGPCVCENVALWDATRREFVMFYRGGWGSQAVGRATSADGVAWAKLPQPVYAADGKDGGEPWVHRDGADLSGTLLLYTTNNHPAHTFISASTDGGLTWAPLANASVPLPPSSSLFGNRVVWREGAQWLMLQEVMSGGPWQIFLYNSSDGVTDWAVLNGGLPLSSLQLHPGGMYGGPRFASIDGVLTPRWADGLYHLCKDGARFATASARARSPGIPLPPPQLATFRDALHEQHRGAAHGRVPRHIEGPDLVASHARPRSHARWRLWVRA